MFLRSGKILNRNNRAVVIEPKQVPLQEKPNNSSSRITKKDMEIILAKKSKDEVLNFAYSLPSLASKDFKKKTKKRIIQTILKSRKPIDISPKRAKKMYTEISKPLSKFLPDDVSDMISTLSDNLKKEEDLLNFINKTFEEYTKTNDDYQRINIDQPILLQEKTQKQFIKIFDINYKFLIYNHFKFSNKNNIDKTFINKNIPIIHKFITNNMIKPFKLFYLIMYNIAIFKSVENFDLNANISELVFNINTLNLLLKNLKKYNIKLNNLIIDVLNDKITSVNKKLPIKMKITKLIQKNPRMAFSSSRSLKLSRNSSTKKALTI